MTLGLDFFLKAKKKKKRKISTLNHFYWFVRALLLVAAKVNTSDHYWAKVVSGETEIATKKVVPPPEKMEDLEPENQAVVEKLMFDNHQRQLGLPTSDEIQKQEILKKLLEKNPNLLNELNSPPPPPKPENDQDQPMNDNSNQNDDNNKK